MSAETFTARPRTVEAMQITEDNLGEIETFAPVRCKATTTPGPGGRSLVPGVRVRNRDGSRTVQYGAYVTKDGRVYTQADFQDQFEAKPATKAAAKS